MFCAVSSSFSLSFATIPAPKAAAAAAPDLSAFSNCSFAS